MPEDFPYRAALGAEQADGRHVLPFDPKVRGRSGFLHGGAIAGLLAIACDELAEAEGAGHEPANSTMRFLRGGRERTTYARAAVRTRTARLLVVEAVAWQEEEDKIIATMSRSYLRRAPNGDGKS
jgi:acyl-coenzyme A thioesterase PaaI-like protein